MVFLRFWGIALVIALVIGTYIGAIILRAACSLINKFVGGKDAPGAVP